MHSTGSILSLRTTSARPRTSSGPPSVAEIMWLATICFVFSNQNTDSPVSTLPLSGIGVGWTASYVEMRSLATIKSGAGSSFETCARSYISRTLPLAIRGRSASGGVTWRDATSGCGGPGGLYSGRPRGEERTVGCSQLPSIDSHCIYDVHTIAIATRNSSPGRPPSPSATRPIPRTDCACRRGRTSTRESECSARRPGPSGRAGSPRSMPLGPGWWPSPRTRPRRDRPRRSACPCARAPRPAPPVLPARTPRAPRAREQLDETPDVPALPRASIGLDERDRPRSVHRRSAPDPFSIVPLAGCVDPCERVVEAPDDLAGIAHVMGVVEDLVEIEPERAHSRVLGEHLAHRDALVPGALRQLLRDAVGVVARHPCRDEREQHALGEQRSVRQLEVLPHAPGIDRHPLDARRRAVL